MAVIRCKMCGAPLPLIPGVTVVECESCLVQQTVPSADNEKKLTLFSRAERLRSMCEFDKAAGVFEAIVADFPEEAEAYWGLVLCKYGIEYVDDPATGEKVPTCHRSSFDRVVDDEDYEMALTYADVVSRRVYVQQARQIEEIRKGIISVSSNEAPYDIFICYKETAEDGDRTLDSVLAQDIYDALTAKGYRVFFARITLEDKLGQEYEPYIFAALNSAKIMLAVGTDFEYFNAVWVKNEWSRYLKLMAKDKDKHLIPCYKGLDAYDMPKEFAKLQAQDLGKVGAMQDLLRGIEKILPRKQETTVVIQTAPSTSSAMVMRGQFALEDGDYQKANEFFEKALDQNPQDGGAYLGKVLSALHLSNARQLDSYFVKIHDDKDFDRAIRFSDPATSAMLSEIRERAHRKYLVKCLTVGLKKIAKQKHREDEKLRLQAEQEAFRIRQEEERQMAEEKRKTDKYLQAQRAFAAATSAQELKDALAEFQCLGDFRDSRDMVAKCSEMLKQQEKRETYMSAYEKLYKANELTRQLEERIQLSTKAAEEFASIPGYGNADELKESSKNLANTLMTGLQNIKRRVAAEEAWAKQQAQYRETGLCQHCGGTFKGIFSKKCSSCGKPKDY